LFSQPKRLRQDTTSSNNHTILASPNYPRRVHIPSIVTTPEQRNVVPSTIHTARLLLRSWQPADAGELLPILLTNWEHLSPWIPTQIATPVPQPALAERLAGNAANFAGNIDWRYAMLRADNQKVLGEIAIFPRSSAGRVSFAESDRAEIGFWLRKDETGQGFVTEAAAAVLAAADSIARFSHTEVRCDARNIRSAAVPQRLGFALLAIEPDGMEVYWRCRDGFPEAG
jgi:RimJ/RimL family protein N-acetyltransferase